MRVAIIADSHFTERSRFAECIRIHEWIAETVAELDVHLVLHSGDVFDAKSTPTERRAVADWLTAVADVAPVVIVRGNHDALTDLQIMSRLRTHHPIIVEEAAGVHVVETAVGPAAVACLGWPRKAELLTRVSAGVDSSTAASEALRAVLTGMGAELAEHDCPRILLTHAMVSGSRTSTGQPLVGCDLELGISDLALARPHFGALGHIHMGQDWTQGDVPFVYPGSPRRTAFGETEAKGFVLANFEWFDGELDGEDAPGARWACEGWDIIDTPATTMLLLEAEWDAASGTLVGTHRLTDIDGAEVRLRYSVTPDQRDAARARAEEYRTTALARGAIVVKLEERVEASVRARAPEIAQAKTLTDKLRAYWAAKGEDLAEREGELLDKAGELEKEAAA